MYSYKKYIVYLYIIYKIFRYIFEHLAFVNWNIYLSELHLYEQ